MDQTECGNRYTKTIVYTIPKYELCPTASCLRFVTKNLQAQCPFYVIANLPLVDFSPANGSTEFWLGTHAHTTGDDQRVSPPEDPLGPLDTFIKDDVLEARRTVRPPIQTVTNKGDITLRDLRLWHAGMPNPSKEHRIMIAIGYQVSKYGFRDLYRL